MFYGKTAEAETFPDALAFMNQFMTWAQENTAWSMLLFMSVFIPPTWLLFRHAPRYPRHNLPEGFFIQVFMASLSLFIDTFAQLTVLWLNILFPICCIATTLCVSVKLFSPHIKINPLFPLPTPQTSLSLRGDTFLTPLIL